jgi:hypothetical protein
MIRLAASVLVILSTLACGGGAAPTAAENLPPAFSGDSDTQTTTFALTGGDYVVDWTATSPADNDCFMGAALKQDDTGALVDVVSVDVTGTRQDSSNLHDVAPGNWYFQSYSHCQWTLRIRL